jgi:site-specific recombinase XerD
VFDLYFCPRVATRLRASPDAGWLGSFLASLHHRRYARLTVQHYLREAELFGRWLRRLRRSLATLTDADVRAFATRVPLRRVRCNARSAGHRLLRHLRERGLVPPRPAPAPDRIERVVAAYDAHLRDAAGLADATRLYRRRYAREFLTAAFGTRPIRWARLRPEHVREFVAGYGRTGRVASAQVAADGLRSFLRWLQMRGRIGPELVAAVPLFPRWRLAALPPVLTDDQLNGLLARFDRSTPVGRRDHAIAVCLIDLGLRVGEVADLTLDDVDAAAGTLRLVAGKPRRERVLPMPQRVRRAVLDYVRRDRPRTTARHLFVRHRLPLGAAVTRSLVRGVIRRAYAAVPGCERLTGTHILRHTAASRLLRAGADLKRIADILGHRSIDTTAAYAKVDVDRLAAVALPWPAAGEVHP